MNPGGRIRGVSPQSFRAATATLSNNANATPDPAAAELRTAIERRKRLGQDRRDEAWEGVLHVVPPPSHRHSTLGAQITRLLAPAAERSGLTVSLDFNLGDGESDYRIPDAGLHRPGAAEMWHPTAALAVEILSPGDETWQKLPFYAAHHVEEILIADPEARVLHWLALEDGHYEPVEQSGLIDLGAVQLARQIDWP